MHLPFNGYLLFLVSLSVAQSPGIREVMVVGVPDIEYEQLITAVVVQQEVRRTCFVSILCR